MLKLFNYLTALELANEIIQSASFTFAGLFACQQKVELNDLKKSFERSVTKRVGSNIYSKLNAELLPLQ